MDMSSMSTRNSGMDMQQGAIVGGIVWVVGVLVTFLLLETGVIGGAGGSFISGSLWFVVAIFSGLHLWPLLTGGSVTASLVWTIVPIILLVIGGFFVANGTRGASFQQGASVVVGYLLLTLVGILFLMVGGPMGASPNIVDMILYLIVGGVVFPAVFGGVGGMVADAM